MNRTPRIILAILAVALVAGSVVAQEQDAKQNRKQNRKTRQAKRQENDQNRRQNRRQDRQRAHQRMMAQICKGADLSEEQQAQLKTVMESFAQDAKNWHKENADKLQALREEHRQAVKDGDTDKLKELREKRQKLMAGLKTKDETNHQQIIKALGEEKGKKVVGMLQAARRRRMARRHPAAATAKVLGDSLTDKQKEILAQTAKAVREAEGRDAKKKAATEGREKFQATLTDEQKQKLATARKRMGRGGARQGREPFSRLKTALGDSLTADQKKILSETSQTVKEADDRDAKRKALGEGMKKLRESLSDEQKQTLRKAMGRRGGRGEADGQGQRGKRREGSKRGGRGGNGTGSNE